MPRKKKTAVSPLPESNGHCVVSALPPHVAGPDDVVLDGRFSDWNAQSIHRIDSAIQQSPDVSFVVEPAPPPPPRLKVAIVGKAPASQQAAPYGDESWEIWTLSNTPFEVPRFTRHFELHQITPRIDKWGPYWKFIKGELKVNNRSTRDNPLYIQRAHPDVPHGIVFPADQVTDAFGRYINNTVSWLIGFAMLHEGLTDLGLWGIDMAQHGEGLKSEYAHQRPSCEFFLGVCAGKGVNVHIPASSDLLKCRNVYGYNANDDFMVKCEARKKELRENMAKCEQLAAQHKAQANEQSQRALVYRGALDDQDWVTEYHH